MGGGASRPQTRSSAPPEKQQLELDLALADDRAPPVASPSALCVLALLEPRASRRWWPRPNGSTGWRGGKRGASASRSRAAGGRAVSGDNREGGRRGSLTDGQRRAIMTACRTGGIDQPDWLDVKSLLSSRRRQRLHVERSGPDRRWLGDGDIVPAVRRAKTRLDIHDTMDLLQGIRSRRREVTETPGTCSMTSLDAATSNGATAIDGSQVGRPHHCTEPRQPDGQRRASWTAR